MLSAAVDPRPWPGGLTARHVAMLHAVAAGRGELTCSRVPDLFVDGRCCTDHAASALLVTAGLVERQWSAATGPGRVPARVTEAGQVLLCRLGVDAARVAGQRAGSGDGMGRVSHGG